MRSFKRLLDLSYHPKDHFWHDRTNDLVPLTVKDELHSKIFCEVGLLQSELYSISDVGVLQQSAKGVQKSIKKTFTSCF